MMKPDERYAAGIKRIQQETGADEETAYAMILLTATLMDMYPWDSEVVDIVLADCKRAKNVDLRKPESCQG